MSETKKVVETEVETEDVENQSEVADSKEQSSAEGEAPEEAPEEEAPEEDAPVGKKRKKPASPSATPSRKSARASKAVEHFSAVPKATASRTNSVPLGEGAGTVLKDIPNVAKNIKKTKVDELKSVHQLLVGTPGKKMTRKKGINQFNGFANDSEEAREVLTTKLTKMTQKQLKTFCDLFDQEKPKDKADLVDGLVGFLFKPTVSSRGPTKKRPLGAFFQFSKEKREEVKEELGDEGSVTAVAKRLGKMWGELTQKQKDSYKSADAPAAKKSKKKPAKKSKKKKESSAEEESSSDDDVIVKGLREKLSRSISTIINDTEELTKRKVMDALKTEYDEDIVTKNKQLIKDIIREQTDSA